MDPAKIGGNMNFNYPSGADAALKLQPKWFEVAENGERPVDFLRLKVLGFLGENKTSPGT